MWGPTGAPGRTTVALGIAGELARRGADPLVLDADPWGGAVGQHLGVLDEVSGLLACARLSPTGELPGRFLTLQRRVAGLRVVTGLPRPDRWVEVREGTVEAIVGLGRRQGDVVVDTGFCLEDDPAAEYAGRAGRNTMTREAIEAADTLVVVGSADPVGLSRLARGLVELHEHTGGRPVHVVVNRMRGSLGWSEAEVDRDGGRVREHRRAARPARRPGRGRPGAGRRTLPHRAGRLRPHPGVLRPRGRAPAAPGRVREDGPAQAPNSR